MNFALIHSKLFYSEFCLPGQQYDRTNKTCENCPKDFYTNRTISKYCIKCPKGYITYGEGSDTCVQLSVPGTGTATLCNINFVNLIYEIYLSHVISYAEQI